MTTAMVRATRLASGHRAPLVTDSRPGTSKEDLAAPKMSELMLRAAAAKQRLAHTWLATNRRHPNVIPCCGGGSAPSAAYVAQTQQAQINGYYCGPAAASEALKQLGKTESQSTTASSLGTTSAGTAWSNSHGYPMANTLNHYQTKNGYVAVGLPGTPSGSQVTTYEDDLVTDIYGIGAPIAGDAYEVVGGPHLVGHPNSNIFHWFDIRGYTSSGRNTAYEDSVHGASSISWSGGVPAYSTMSSATIAEIVGGRGYRQPPGGTRYA